MQVRHHGLKAVRFHDLAPHRVREVLLVSSEYDAFVLEEDGQLTEQVFFEFREINASGAPRFTHVPTAKAALAALENRRFDIILVMSSLTGMGINALARKVKELRPGRPVIFLALDAKETDRAQRSIDRSVIDGTFLWNGNAEILLAIVKSIEDRDNVAYDTRHGDVRVIIMIEDSPRYYSAFLGLLYKELMTQARSLAAEGVNELHRLMYMRSRPKILHATSYEEALELFQRYKSNVLAVISDVRIPRAGKLDPAAGVEFARLTQRDDPERPILLQSADPENAALAAKIGAEFVDKNSPTVLAKIRDFLSERLGFGDFVFRTSNGAEVGRARDLRELEEKLKTLPGESLAYHSAHNHFSIWLMARSEFALAERLRPRTISELGGVEGTRRHLLAALRYARRSTYLGHVADLSRRTFEHDLFSRTGQGALGGKARGIAFLYRSLSDTHLPRLDGLPVKIPKTVVITTERFDEFLDDSNLREFLADSPSDTEIARRFLEAPLPEGLQRDLAFVLESFDKPLAVRSSSLLEDSLHQPFAGIYSTLMIPNGGTDLARRFRELGDAVKLVYASTFSFNARSYLSTTGHLSEEEKMAVILQPIVGSRHGPRFYPTFSGVAQSINFYPVGPQRARDGIVHVALGLGRVVVDGGQALRFSPRHPGVLPQFSTPKALLDHSQRSFYALDLEAPCCEADGDPFANVREFDLAKAEGDGVLPIVGSVFSHEDQRFREDLSLPGPRVVSFTNILKHRALPLAEAIKAVLKIATDGTGGPVEIEFACDMGDWGRPRRRGREPRAPELHLLQMRPFGARDPANKLHRRKFSAKEVLCASRRSLGHGIDDDIRDLVYVRRQGWRAASNQQIAHEIGRLNHRLCAEHRHYVLIGPGRWGSADRFLGIPVKWGQISNARVMVEASPTGYDVEPSQGTHFFQNITSLGIGYLTMPAGVGGREPGSSEFLDWEWLDSQPAEHETEHLRLLRFEEPFSVVLDGRKGAGLIVKPGRPPAVPA